jgi:hypothetical protein
VYGGFCCLHWRKVRERRGVWESYSVPSILVSSTVCAHDVRALRPFLVSHARSWYTLTHQTTSHSYEQRGVTNFHHTGSPFNEEERA